MTIEEAKKVVEELRAYVTVKLAVDGESVRALNIALWLMERERLVRAMEVAYYDTDSRHAFQCWEADNPRPGSEP